MKTALYEAHKSKNAKFISFAGWEMPLSYTSTLLEVETVRKKVGLFDVSHMGQIFIQGPETIAFLDFLSTNTISGKSFGKAIYTVFCDETGGAVDDLLVYLIDKTHAFLVVNAANRDKCLAHVRMVGERFDVTIEEGYSTHGLLSLQGKNSPAVLRALFPEIPLPAPMCIVPIDEENLRVSRTGYTGEEGYEFYGPEERIQLLWDELLEKGEPFGIQPIGLAARDILRLEMGFALYGHELSSTINPLESVAAWAVKMDAHDFLGKAALKKKQKTGALRTPLALLGSASIAREGFPLFFENAQIGMVTSGSFSPTLQKPIALALSDLPFKPGASIDVCIRGEYYPFTVVKLPFILRST